MIDSSRFFRDVSKRIQQDIADETSLEIGMQQWFDFYESLQPSTVWSRLRNLDFNKDFTALTNWLSDLLSREPPPADITGLWFGLRNPCKPDGSASCQMYLAGSKRFTPKMDVRDWHCNPEYWPNGRYSFSEVLDEIYCTTSEQLGDDGFYFGEAGLCHGYVSLVLAEWCRGPLKSLLLGDAKLRGITFGHDSGDIHLVTILGNLEKKK